MLDNLEEGPWPSFISGIKNLRDRHEDNRINEISKDLEAQGKDVFKFGFGQSPFKVPDDVVLELKNNANKNNYLPVQGLPELREAIAKNISIKKNYNYSAESILIGPGTKELMFLLNILFDGDVLLPAPSWV